MHVLIAHAALCSLEILGLYSLEILGAAAEYVASTEGRAVTAPSALEPRTDRASAHLNALAELTAAAGAINGTYAELELLAAARTAAEVAEQVQISTDAFNKALRLLMRVQNGFNLDRRVLFKVICLKYQLKTMLDTWTPAVKICRGTQQQIQ